MIIRREITQRETTAGATLKGAIIKRAIIKQTVILPFFLILPLLLLSLTYAQVELRPAFNVTFTEVVNESTINISLTSRDKAVFDIELVSSANPVFVYRPKQDLPEDFYNVKAQARDLSGNLGPLIEGGFLVQIPPLSITFAEPRFGVTSSSLFNLTIRTDRNAFCNYSFNSDTPYQFDSSGFLEHRKKGISIAEATPLNIQCLDSYGKRHQKEMQLIFDSAAPVISVSAGDVTELPLEATLRVASNEEVICKFDSSSLVFEDMKKFDGYNESKEDAYKISPSQKLDKAYLKDRMLNRFFVRCMDKSGKLSNLAEAGFNVDISQPASITIHYPAGVLTSNILRFNVSTSRIADYCQYTNSSPQTDFITFSGEGKSHISSSLRTLNDGVYNYYIRCRFHNESGVWYLDGGTNFIIDSTKPAMLYVSIISPLKNISDKTYKDNELCAKWKAEDNQSSIKLYSYAVYRDGAANSSIAEGTTSSVDGCIEAKLNNTAKYYFVVMAQNSVGLWSDNMSSPLIQVDKSLAPIGCSNSVKDGDETDIDCGGSCKGCANKKNCLLDSDCSSRYCNESNKCESSSCNDRVRNGDETDKDCGGSCRKCDIDEMCNKDSDCGTNNCDASTGECGEAEVLAGKCENDRQDIGETDIDCGGSCPPCAVNKKCDLNSDCVKGAKCDEGICSLDSDKDGVVDSKDNCPDVANVEQSDADNDKIGDSCDPDSDNDGLPDSFEQQYFDCVTCANPEDDVDKDGLTNLEEYGYNTNPTKADTDGDGYSDKEELDKGTDTLDPNSYPKGGFLMYILIVAAAGILGGGGFFVYKLLSEKKEPFIAGRMPAARGLRTPQPFPQRRMPIRAVNLPRRAIRPIAGSAGRRAIVMPGGTAAGAAAKPFTPPPSAPTTPSQPGVQKGGIQPQPVQPSQSAVSSQPAAESSKSQLPPKSKEPKSEEENIFKRLSKITEEDKSKQAEKKSQYLKERGFNEKIERLRKGSK